MQRAIPLGPPASLDIQCCMRGVPFPWPYSYFHRRSLGKTGCIEPRKQSPPSINIRDTPALPRTPASSYKQAMFTARQTRRVTRVTLWRVCHPRNPRRSESGSAGPPIGTRRSVAVPVPCPRHGVSRPVACRRRVPPSLVGLVGGRRDVWFASIASSYVIRYGKTMDTNDGEEWRVHLLRTWKHNEGTIQQSSDLKLGQAGGGNSGSDDIPNGCKQTILKHVVREKRLWINSTLKGF